MAERQETLSVNEAPPPTQKWSQDPGFSRFESGTTNA